MNLILASASPRRADILCQLGFEFSVRPVDIDESVHPNEAPEAYLERVVDAKALAATLQGAHMLPTETLLVADTVVVCDGQILGKPQTAAEHIHMLTQLRGRMHWVMTRFALRYGLVNVARTVRTEVYVSAISDEQLRHYVAQGEGSDKAGGYAIQGLFARYIEGIAGSYTSVVGLPAHEVSTALLALSPSR